MSKVVLDSSALLALCFGEDGAKRAQSRGKDGVISAVTYSETIAKATDTGVPLETVQRALASLKLTIVPFDEEHAVAAASFRAATRALNISFAGRACLAAASLARLPVLTGDRKWEQLACGIKIILIR